MTELSERVQRAVDRLREFARYEDRPETLAAVLVVAEVLEEFSAELHFDEAIRREQERAQ